MKFLEGQTAFVTGGSRGMGKAIALHLAGAGAKVAVCARREGDLEAAGRELRAIVPDCLALPLDISRAEDVQAGVERIEATLGPIDILINNAGIFLNGPVWEMTVGEWDAQFGINLKGQFLVTRAVVPGMIARRRGRVLFISSIAAQYYRKNFTLYFASKWALSGFAHCVAKETHEYNIHVHILCPGMTETNFFETLNGRPHPEECAYLKPDTVAALAEHLVCLPENVDTNEYSLFPSFQLKNFGIRR